MFTAVGLVVGFVSLLQLLGLIVAAVTLIYVPARLLGKLNEF